MGKNNNKNRNLDPFSNSRSMGREGMRIIKDIAFGNYDFFTNGHIFRNKDFVMATIQEVDKRLLEASIHLSAMGAAYGQNPADPAVQTVMNRDRKTYEAYSIIKRTLSDVVETGDTGFVYVLLNKLPSYKYNI